MNARSKLAHVERAARGRLRHNGERLAAAWRAIPDRDLEVLAARETEHAGRIEAITRARWPNLFAACDRLLASLPPEGTPHDDGRWYGPLPGLDDDAHDQALEVLDASDPDDPEGRDALALARLSAHLTLGMHRGS